MGKLRNRRTLAQNIDDATKSRGNEKREQDRFGPLQGREDFIEIAPEPIGAPAPNQRPQQRACKVPKAE